ncbi:sensor histidine kinase [Chryseobacterium hispalense]|uniref:sensor histidine kinase n=1 Tax=Chryseobacterium hispalense TaxID=1453492 RepID=UPI0004939F3D|nr:histidine kinase [Chryseobacterium hispalense]
MHKNLHNEVINENQMFKFLILRKYRVFRHMLLICFSILVLFYSKPEYIEPFETYNRMIIFFMVMLLAYSNMYLFVPRFLFKNQYLNYALSVLAFIIFWSAIQKIYSYYFTPYLLPNDENEVNILSLSFIVLVLSIASAAVKLFQQWIMDTQLINELVKANARTELEQLKNQINPHFLFNMLNNANVLTQKDPEKASQVLLRLSDLLRYQLYDSSREKVLLTSDIHFLEDFLNLEKIRRDNFTFIISKEGSLSGVQIPPLLFISFAENAVKHNNDTTKSSFTNLFFEVKDDELIFQCINSKPLQKAVSQSGGLGLANIKRRLELLFPSTHSLKITDNEETFTVYLSIKL